MSKKKENDIDPIISAVNRRLNAWLDKYSPTYNTEDFVSYEDRSYEISDNYLRDEANKNNRCKDCSKAKCTCNEDKDCDSSCKDCSGSCKS